MNLSASIVILFVCAAPATTHHYTLELTEPYVYFSLAKWYNSTAHVLCVAVVLLL